MMYIIIDSHPFLIVLCHKVKTFFNIYSMGVSRCYEFIKMCPHPHDFGGHYNEPEKK